MKGSNGHSETGHYELDKETSSLTVPNARLGFHLIHSCYLRTVMRF